MLIKKIFIITVFLIFGVSIVYADEIQMSAQPIILENKKNEKIQEPFKAITSAEVAIYQKISLPEAIKYAFENNLGIKSKRLNVNIAKNNIKSAGRFQNPFINSFVNFGEAATDNPNSVGMIFPIEIAKRGARKNFAKSNLELTKGTVAFSELFLRLDVRQAYVNVVAAKSNLKILDDQRILLQELYRVSQKKFDAGAVPKMEVIHAKMTLNQLLIQVNTANTAVYTARYNFNRILNSFGYDTQEDYLPEQNKFVSMLTPSPTGKMPEFATLLKIALEKRIDLQNAKKDVTVAEKNLTVVVRKRIPDIELGLGYMVVPPQLATNDDLNQGGYVMFNIRDIPLLYRYAPEIKNAKLLVDQKKMAYDQLKIEITMNLHSAYDKFNTAQDNLNYYNDVLLSESNQFLHMARRSYEVGKTNIADFIFVQQSYKSIMLGYINALAEYYNAWVGVLKEVNDEELNLNG